MLARDWRGGELGILLAALVLSVGVVSGISAFTTRLQSALEQESHRFLAADMVVRSSRGLPAEWLQRAAAQGLTHAETLQFPSMVYAGEDKMYLASVKAVSDSYPLRGELTASDVPFGEVQLAQRGPLPGEVWLDSRLFPLLGVAIGETVGIGEREFVIAAAARTEPDQGTSFYGFGPRVIMHYGDIESTAVVQPGSRVEYRQLYAGAQDAVDTFDRWLEPLLADGQSVVKVGEGQPGIDSALERAEGFLLLSGSLAVVLAGVAVALAARRFSERHHDYVAILKSLGASSQRVNRLYGTSLMILGGVATGLGCVLGWSLQAVFFVLFGDQLPLEPGAAGVRPYAIGATTAMTCLLCFAWPPLRRLGGTSPLRVLRRDMPLESRRAVTDYLLGLGAISLLMWWYSQDLALTVAVLAGLLLTAGLGFCLALLLLRGGRLVGMSAGSIWRLALSGLQRRGAANALQVVIFAMAIMLLLMLLLVRTSLIDEWQTQLPDDVPNHFMVNVVADEVQAIEATLRGKSIKTQPFFPMIRGRIMAVNGTNLPATQDVKENRRQREVNFTWSEQLPPDNLLVSGQWWEPGTQEAVVSLEDEFADRMDISVGDTVTFLVGAEPFDARVSSVRQLDWQSMQPNFYLVFPPALLTEFPATFMTSFHLGRSEKRFLNEFIREFPTVTVVEMDAVIEQIRTIINQVTAAINLVLAVILGAGVLVLVAGVQASVDARMQESAILRALGASRQLILGGLLIEFVTMGLFAGLLAVVGAELSVYILQTRAMDMVYTPAPWIWPTGLAFGALLIGGLGVYCCRRVVLVSPLVVLRDI
ncbi:MAG: ABC transporter permease [Halieaceae bacterium]|nr:ABC transporter permease [Halieaceae bacterium]